MEVQSPAEGCSSQGMEEIQLSQEPLKKCGMDAGIPASSNGCLDCNICLDFAVDPVVTLCGHLYCWPCMYKWLQQAEGISQQQCPVCKASISENTLVPLYGRGHSTKRHQETLEIPRRPSVHRGAMEPQSSSTSSNQEPYSDMYPPILRHQQQHYHLHQHDLHHHYPSYSSIPGSDPMPPSSPRVIGSTAGGVFGGLAVAVLPWMFRNQEAASWYHSSSPYYTAGNGGSPRLRRQEMELERVLHQIWVFLFCCAMLCLLFF